MLRHALSNNEAHELASIVTRLLDVANAADRLLDRTIDMEEVVVREAALIFALRSLE